MKILFQLFLLLVSLLLYACMKHEPFTRACELQTGTASLDQAGQVHYLVTHTGSFYVDEISYYGPQGLVTTKKPSLPFTASFDMPAGATVGLTAAGTAISGKLYITCSFMNGTDTLGRKQDACGN